MIKEIKCKTCHKVIGHYDSKTGTTLDQTDDFNSCDICGEELCYNCSVTYEDFNGCKHCLKKYKKGMVN